MIERIIEADENALFLSDVLTHLPSHCLLNKGITGCGGTTLEIESDRNSIILVPNINLVINKTAAHVNLIGLYGDIAKWKFIDNFKKQKSYKKIIATYDSLPKLIEWIGEDVYNYFLLVDEYHILFNSYALRYKAITNVLSLFRRFNDYCFMTATPLTDDTILDELKGIDTLTIEWPNSVKINVKVENEYRTSKRVVEHINNSLDRDYNLHIFINSINTIRSIVKNMDCADFRTICSKNSESKDKKMGGKLNVESINSPVRKVNFYTATAFEGVDIYDPVGKTIVVSDTVISTSLVDISTLFIQICGRLRDSVYKDDVTFICNTSDHRYMQHKTLEDFELTCDEITSDALEYEDEFTNSKPGSRKTKLGSFERDITYYQGRYIGRKLDTLYYDPNLRKLDMQNYNIINNTFKSTVSVLYNLNKTNKINATKAVDQVYLDVFNAIGSNLQLTYTDVFNIVYPVLGKHNIINIADISNILDMCSDKRRLTINGKKQTVYDFNKLRSII